MSPEINFDLVNVEILDRCIHCLKLGIARGTDGLGAESLLNAHPINL